MASVSSHIKSGILWNVLASFARYGLQFAAVMILARLLSPAEYGLVGLLAIFIAVADALVDSGLGGAVVKKEGAQPIDFSTLTVYNLVVSIVIFLLYVYGATWVADYYGQPELEGLLRLYSVCIIVYALSIAPRAMLAKQLRFKAIALLNTLAGAVALVVAIVLAYRGFKAYAIVWQYLVNALVFSVGAMILVRYRFSLAFSWASFREQFNFGFFTMVTMLLRMVNENIYSNVIGKKASMNQTGCYSQSMKVMNIPVGFLFNMIEGTFFPVMSQITDRNEFQTQIIRLNQRTMGCILVLFTLLLPINREIVLVLLGEQWIDSIWTVRMLLLAGMFISMGNVGSNLIKCTGRTFLMMRCEVVVLAVSLSGLWFIASCGYEAIVCWFLAVCAGKFVLLTIVACRQVEIGVWRFLRPLWWVALCCLLFVALFSQISIGSLWLSIIVKGAVYLLLGAIGFLLFRRYKARTASAGQDGTTSGF